jgi:hypothetical protein
MKGIMKNLIGKSKKVNILGLILLAVAGISAGCSTTARSSETSKPTIAKNDSTPAPTPVVKAASVTEAERRFDGDFEGDMEYSTPKPAAKTSRAATINKAAFEKISVGMTLAEVEKIIGEEGLLVGTNIINGRKTQIYKWSSDNFSSYIDVTIENGKVAEKKDKNLK